MTAPESGTTSSPVPPPLTTRPWAALGALCVGFFMILVDMTIVAVAQPKIQEGIGTDFNGVIWVTSAYLLTYAVPLLITGRLGDRFGPKSVYQAGLVVFTLASLWCGLSGSIGELIAARGLQGLGAALITPQTMAVITRIFPADKRGTAMGVWGTVAGVATLVGPLLGGILTDQFGWEWIFFVNIPVGVVGLFLAWWLVPAVPTRNHSFDLVGVALSAIGLSALVFGIQDGEKYDWAAWIWSLIVGGIVVMGLFVWWQSRIRTEPLVPLSLFADRNFSLANIGIATMGFAISGLMVPLMFFLQLVGGMTPTQSAVMMVPMAVLTGVLAPIVGRFVDKVHPRYIVATSLLLNAAAVLWLGAIASPVTPVWELIIPMGLMGVASAGIWAPLAATATRNLPMSRAGAGAGVYNTTRMIGSVLGSAAVGALMQTRLAAELPGLGGKPSEGATGQLPAMIRDPFATAMGQTILLPGLVLLIGVVATVFFQRPQHMGRPQPTATPRGSTDAEADAAVTAS
ncbi:MFS transporter [Williamsia sterculiae]|uniref:Drug resistance transporter, EmrB/QacA subfamily n=1 Tax=Williamsia sterculiae TaxID=1344003 RepID=A0A1N7E1P2_9NOCA|nr:MFS transporter [Williamsia sterculiae]SIR81983.1 drug resistance transporter, EmrB/QacA subfamily [Williamsia sterculiae]